jgi:hypothetical protein
MRVAIVLDNTGSMAESNPTKISALRTAVAGTNGFIDQLSKLASNPGDVLVSIIPFAKTVNAGASNYSADWIDWTDWLNPPTQQQAYAYASSSQTTLPMNWHAVGPGARCPFTTSSNGFYCTTGPANGSSKSTSSNKNVIPSSGTYSGYICPSLDSNSSAYYNGCWTSEPTGKVETFCSGSSSCACPLDASGAAVTGCSCTGNGSSKSCSGNTYVHNWTQPTVTVGVGFPNRKWTPSTSTPTVPNNYTLASTNPISTWTGCITDRKQPYDTTSDGASVSKFPAIQDHQNGGVFCPSNASPKLEQMMPLSSDWATLKANVNAMQPTGMTNQAIGLAWGWQSLLTTSPIPAPAENNNENYNRVIILLSDGLNTEDRWVGYGVSQIDARQTLMCQNIKAMTDPKTNKPMYTIYAIQVNTSVPADPTSTVLQNCATSVDATHPGPYFFMLSNSTDIASTFNNIGVQLSQLRIAQ